MSGDLQYEASVASLKEQLAFWWSADRQSAKNKGPGTKRQSLILLLAFDADKATALGLPELLLGYDQLRHHLFESRAGRLKSCLADCVRYGHTSTIDISQSSPRVSASFSGARLAKKTEGVLWVFESLRTD